MGMRWRCTSWSPSRTHNRTSIFLVGSMNRIRGMNTFLGFFTMDRKERNQCITRSTTAVCGDFGHMVSLNLLINQALSLLKLYKKIRDKTYSHEELRRRKKKSRMRATNIFVWQKILIKFHSRRVYKHCRNLSPLRNDHCITQKTS